MILVTGGAGFIGGNFVLDWLANPKAEGIVNLDKLTYAGNLSTLESVQNDSHHVFVKGDIGDYELVLSLLKKHSIRAVINFAAESHVDNSIKTGLPFVKTNVEGTYNLIEVARQNKKLKKFLHISTDEVYGDRDNREPAHEFTPLEASSYYSATKTASDLLVMAAGRTYDFPYLITRTCNNYGENQHKEKFVPKIIYSIKNGLEVPVYGDGQQVREWIHADDNAAAIYKLLMSDKVKEVYNIGTGERYQNIEILKMIGDVLGKEVNFKYVDDRLGHDRRYALHCGKYIYDFGDIQTVNFQEWLSKNI
jgi:dTDP-glucose 4,6-dehydratase